MATPLECSSEFGYNHRCREGRAITSWLIRESGGIGRRTRLRIWRGNPWGFESPLSHQKLTRPVPVDPQQLQLRRELPDDAEAIGAAKVGGAIKVALGIEDYVTDRKGTIIAAGEVVKVGEVPAAV